MKPKWRRAFRVLVLTAPTVLSTIVSIRAQSISVLYNFSPTDSSFVNSDGKYPRDFVAYNGRFYGVTIRGGDFGDGVIYSVNLDGTDFRTLHSFGNEDAGRPLKPIIVSDGVIYGTSELAMGGGVIFAINTDGSDYRYVHQFSADDGTRPLCELTLDGNTLYGTAADGGPIGGGTVFSVNTNGQNFSVLQGFDPLSDQITQTNIGGASPQVGLTLDNGVLYGGTTAGGKSSGTIFRLNVDGSNFKTLHEFAASTGVQINSDGISVSGKMLILNGKLYGTTELGGPGATGVFFSMDTNGSNYKVLHSFPAATTKREMGYPQTLVAVGSRLYGGGWTGGAFGRGALFQLDIPTGTYKTLYDFPAVDSQGRNTNGMMPEGRLFVNSSKLYFTATGGGSGGDGIIGMLQLQIPQPTLDISQSEPGVRILIHGQIGVTYSLEQSQTLFGTDWQPQLDVLVSQTPQQVDLPLPSVSTYWRARVE